MSGVLTQWGGELFDEPFGDQSGVPRPRLEMAARAREGGALAGRRPTSSSAVFTPTTRGGSIASGALSRLTAVFARKAVAKLSRTRAHRNGRGPEDRPGEPMPRAAHVVSSGFEKLAQSFSRPGIGATQVRPRDVVLTRGKVLTSGRRHRETRDGHLDDLAWTSAPRNVLIVKQHNKLARIAWAVL